MFHTSHHSTPRPKVTFIDFSSFLEYASSRGPAKWRTVEPVIAVTPSAASKRRFKSDDPRTVRKLCILAMKNTIFFEMENLKLLGGILRIRAILSVDASAPTVAPLKRFYLFVPYCSRQHLAGTSSFLTISDMFSGSGLICLVKSARVNASFTTDPDCILLPARGRRYVTHPSRVQSFSICCSVLSLSHSFWRDCVVSSLRCKVQ